MTTSLAYFIGDVSLDEYYAAERWPGVADKGFVTSLGDYVGGSIANAACVHTGLGGQTEFISLLNDSAISQRLTAALTARGVSVRHMLIEPKAPESRNFIFLIGGDHVVLTIDMGTEPMELTSDLMTAMRAPGFLYTTLYRVRRLRHGELVGADLLAELRRYGRRTVFDLDVGGFMEADLPNLEGAAILIFNQAGYATSFGERTIDSLGDWMARMAISVVIRTRAADGAEAFDGREHFEVPGFTVPVEDVTGAGDTFGGALVYALGQDWPLGKALELAVAASARSVMVRGPQGGVAPLAVVQAFRTRERF